MSSTLNITLAQLNPTLGDVDGNAHKILDVWENSKSDLIIFPELFLCGYPPEDLCHNLSFIKALESKFYELLDQSKSLKPAALIPTIWMEKGNIYNAALLIEHGKIRHVFKKHHLPNYSVFDEARNFISAPMPEPIQFRGTTLGIMICEDMWFDDMPSHLSENGAELLIAINASPYHTTKYERRMEIAKNCVDKSRLPLLYANLVGAQDELVFDGRSFTMDPTGKLTYEASPFAEEILHIEYKNHEVLNVRTDIKSRAPFDLDLYNALVTGTRDYIIKNGFKDVLIGLSGGIDSALVAAIAFDALGADHVHCVMMPSEFTSEESLADAKACAQTLGVQYDIIQIKDAIKTYEAIIPDLKGLAHENTQSRIRGTILMAISNASGAMLLTTGNKSEMAVGYCTIYGDMNGGFNPIKDIYKTKVYELATWRNTISEAIPERILSKAPSAELRADQTDQDSLPPYDLLDDILYALIECDDMPCPQDIKTRIREHPKTIEKVATLLKNSEYKRYQAAPGVRVSTKAFGRDRRYPMTNAFINRIEKT